MSKIIKGGFASFSDETTEKAGFKIKEKPKFNDDFQDLQSHTETESSTQVTAEDIIESAKLEAKRILEDAQEQSRQYIKESRERVDTEVEANMQKGFEQGYQKGLTQGKIKGYEDGYQEGLDESDELYKKNIAFMQGVIEGIDDAKHMMLKKYEGSLSDLAYTMARMIVKKELKENPKTLNKMIEAAAETCKNQEYILVTLSQAGYDLIVGDDESVLQTLRTYSDDIRFYVDKSMSDTDCVIETPVGVINASLDVQLDNIKEQMKSHEAQQN